MINTDSFEEALLRAVNLGYDTDTIGAVSGGLAGLYYGYNAIPEAWLAALQKRDWIESLCEGSIFLLPQLSQHHFLYTSLCISSSCIVDYMLIFAFCQVLNFES